MNTTRGADVLKSIKDFKPAEPQLTEYRLMYLFGAWVTEAKIYAETDEEAIFDADYIEKPAINKLEYSLFCGDREVKKYSNFNHYVTA